MKINNATGNESIIKNGYARDRMENGNNEPAKVKNGSINVSGVNVLHDEIANKKQKIVKDALEFVKNQFKSDGEIDEVVDSCRERSAQSREALKEVQNELNALGEETEQLKEEYGEDSEEYKELIKDYDEMKGHLEEQKQDAQNSIAAQSAAIRGIKQEMVKNHGMEDAQKAKEQLLETATKEIVNSLVEESREKIEEDIKNQVEKGEEQKEEKEELEAKLEEIQAEQKKKARDTEEEAKTSKSTAPDYTHANEIIEKQRQLVEQAAKMAGEQRLLLEELKGVAVNTIL